MTDFARLIATLAEAKVDFVIVGGLAATIHGSARLTQDVDVVRPYLRGAPAGLPFDWSAETLKRGLNFTLTTDSSQ